MKLLIQGPVKSGKTTLTQKIIRANRLKIFGIKTKKTATGITIGYVKNGKLVEWRKCADNVFGKMIPIKEAFDSFGSEIILRLIKTKNEKTAYLVDEIGFVELVSEKYCDLLIKLLSKKKKEIEVIKNKENPLKNIIKKKKFFL